jgi:hypothetical protein
MLELTGNYLIEIKLGDLVLPIQKDSILELVISSDINKMVPEFRLVLRDPQGVMTHLMPFDKDLSRIKIQIGKSINSDVLNEFDFLVYKAFPENKFGTGMTYIINGLLNVDKLFTPTYCRGFNDTLDNTLTTLSNEFNNTNIELGSGLDNNILVLQPDWSNAKLLLWLTKNYYGSGGQYLYYSFIKNVNGFRTFVFKGFDELSKSNPSYRFIMTEKPYEDFYPVFEFSILDKYKVFGVFGSKKQTYSYYDYDNSEFIDTEKGYEDFFSLTEYFLIDKEDTEDSIVSRCTGRNNEFTEDFSGKILSQYYKRLSNLVRMWITTWGIENISVGDVVDVFFPQGGSSANLYNYQYSGYWVVERIVHIIDDTFRTRLLLTRNGLETSYSTSLLKADNRKKVI